MTVMEKIKVGLNPALSIYTVILTMYDGRTNLAQQVAEEVRNVFGDAVAQTVIPRNVRLSEAPSFGQPISIFDPKSKGAIAYIELAHELAKRD
jgi:chromosome partitioning protein